MEPTGRLTHCCSSQFAHNPTVCSRRYSLRCSPQRLRLRTCPSSVFSSRLHPVYGLQSTLVSSCPCAHLSSFSHLAALITPTLVTSVTRGGALASFSHICHIWRRTCVLQHSHIWHIWRRICAHRNSVSPSLHVLRMPIGTASSHNAGTTNSLSAFLDGHQSCQTLITEDHSCWQAALYDESNRKLPLEVGVL